MADIESIKSKSLSTGLWFSISLFDTTEKNGTRRHLARDHDREEEKFIIRDNTNRVRFKLKFWRVYLNMTLMIPTEWPIVDYKIISSFRNIRFVVDFYISEVFFLWFESFSIFCEGRIIFILRIFTIMTNL